MCGRFALFHSTEKIEDYVEAKSNLLLKPHYNIAPSQKILSVRQSNHDKRELVLLHWGLIPSWMKEEKFNSAWINARIESAHEKPAFRQAFKQRRCLIPASGFYEWKPLSRGKQPYFIRKKDQFLMALAGIWEHWQDREGNTIESCAILTTDANSQLEAIHNRMPVILEPADFTIWLDPHHQNVDELLALAKPDVSRPIEAYAVGNHVNKPSHDVSDCIIPIET